jgi:hypothetical protein
MSQDEGVISLARCFVPRVERRTPIEPADAGTPGLFLIKVSLTVSQSLSQSQVTRRR